LPLTQRNACFFPYNPHIGEDGEVYACCFLDYNGRTLYSEEGPRQMPGLSLGNAAELGFKTVWESDAYVDLRRRNLLGEFSEDCRACYLLRIQTSDRVREVLGLPG